MGMAFREGGGVSLGLVVCTYSSIIIVECQASCLQHVTCLYLQITCDSSYPRVHVNWVGTMKCKVLTVWGLEHLP